MKEHPHGGADPTICTRRRWSGTKRWRMAPRAWLRARRPARQLDHHRRPDALSRPPRTRPDRAQNARAHRSGRCRSCRPPGDDAKPELEGFDYGFVMTPGSIELTSLARSGRARRYPSWCPASPRLRWCAPGAWPCVLISPSGTERVEIEREVAVAARVIPRSSAFTPCGQTWRLDLTARRKLLQLEFALDLCCRSSSVSS